MVSNSRKLVVSPYLIFLRDFKSKGRLIIKNQLTRRDYCIDDINIELLQRCSNTIEKSQLLMEFDSNEVEKYLERELLIYQEEVWDKVNPIQASIEVNTGCNYSCKFCPTDESVTNHVMEIEVFRKIIDKLDKIDTLEYVTLSSYNEPLMDKFFLDRLEILREFDMKLNLVTNGRYLDENILQALENSGVVALIRINFPSLDRQEYCRLMGADSNDFDEVIKNIKGLEKSKLKFELQVNGTKTEKSKNIKYIEDKYSEHAEKIINVVTMDRCGTLKNEYSNNVDLKGYMPGWCFRPLTSLVIGINGDIILCCNDYNKKNVIGNILENDVLEVMRSNIAKELRKRVYGYKEIESDFVCGKCEYMKRGNTFKRFSPLYRPKVEQILD